MQEASCSRQAVFNFLGLLQRNGFIDKRPRLREDGARRSSDYWLLFDRIPAKWISSFREENSSDEPESEETGGEGTHSGLVENSAESPLYVPSESAPCTPIYEPSDSNRQSPQLKDGRKPSSFAPKEFSAKARTEQVQRLKAAEEARKPKRIPVIEGSRPWEAWVKAGHPRTLTCTVEVNGKFHRGWYFETEKCDGLYPKRQQSTGPPDPMSEFMSEADYDDIKMG